jgi:hypothetical protein
MRFTNPLLIAIGLMAMFVLVGFASRFFAPDARLERRRRRNNYRVVSKSKRRMVTLNARTKE